MLTIAVHQPPVPPQKQCFLSLSQNECKEISRSCKRRQTSLSLFTCRTNESIGWYCVFCQVQEPASEDEYEVCDHDEGVYEIQCEAFYSPHE